MSKKVSIKNIESNIGKLYIIKALHRFMLTMPIIVLFLQKNGLSMKEVLFLQSIFSVGVILFEIPSGYFSDIIENELLMVYVE